MVTGSGVGLVSRTAQDQRRVLPVPFHLCSLGVWIAQELAMAGKCQTESQNQCVNAPHGLRL